MNLSVRFFLLLIFNTLLLKSQNFAWPLDSPCVLTANYGELRPDHFHAGIDFSTKGKINFPVYAIADGYVSRIKVSAGGYGKCLYITHNDGHVSVYAHLNAYIPAIARIVKQNQYSVKSYETEIFPAKGEIPVQRKQMIGYSGNSGGSTGPHLHFEIRDAQSEVPLNPLEYFPVADTLPPVLQNISFYNLADTASPKFLRAFPVINKKDGQTVLKKDSIILTQGILGFAYEGYDLFTLGGSPNNIFNAKLYFDGRQIYGHSLSKIDFSDARFVNEFSEQVEVSKKEKYRMQKCFVPTLFPAGFYDQYRNKGRILLTDTTWHNIKLALHDENGNETILNFTFKTRKLNYYSKPSIKSDFYAHCEEDFMIAKNKLQIFIPAKTLYYSTGLIFENTIDQSGKLIILPTDANLRTTSIVGFEVPSRYRAIKNKLVLKTGDKVLVPIVHNDSVFYSVKNLGWFLLDRDTVSPKIKAAMTPAQFSKNKKVSKLSFELTDNLSGIKKYELLLNGKWVLGEFDQKSGSLQYEFDEETPKSGKLNFTVNCEDRVGNSSTLIYSVVR